MTRMNLRPGAPASPYVMARLAIAGMCLAVISLGGLALWSAFVAQHEAHSLTRVAVQTTGQLRALQQLYVIRVETDALEEDFTEARLARLRAAERALPEALTLMGIGDAAAATRVAAAAQPVAAQLVPAIERFLVYPRGDILYHGDSDDGDDTAEDAMEVLVDRLDLLLNDSGSDPADLLNAKLDEVRETGSLVSTTAMVLVPVGLGSVVACAWLLRGYRRRSESAMKTALAVVAQEARTDELTSLPNRRGLLEELERWVEDGRVFTLGMADLNGFKFYNDTFGHPAGDALLRRLGSKLAAAWEGHGVTARLGGDEFCVLTDDLAPEHLQELLQTALSDEGEGFTISSVSGVASVPTEATDPSAALRLADTRLYAAKAVFRARGRSPQSGPPSHPLGPVPAQGTLARLIEQRYPGLGNHLNRVTQMAVGCAHDLGLPAEEVEIIERAAQLYDIGKIALPAAILTKGGVLTDDEEDFMRRHGAIGERLLTGMDDLASVAVIVRATHERWDGDGYPDQLSGERIPIGSRIIAVVDAFCAMTSDRPDTPARPIDDAIAELNRCSGRQFDPGVVALVTEAIGRGGTLGPAGNLVRHTSPTAG